jgi:hypothetical protein
MNFRRFLLKNTQFLKFPLSLLTPPGLAKAETNKSRDSEQKELNSLFAVAGFPLPRGLKSNVTLLFLFTVLFQEKHKKHN